MSAAAELPCWNGVDCYWGRHGCCRFDCFAQQCAGFVGARMSVNELEQADARQDLVLLLGGLTKSVKDLVEMVSKLVAGSGVTATGTSGNNDSSSDERYPPYVKAADGSDGSAAGSSVPPPSAPAAWRRGFLQRRRALQAKSKRRGPSPGHGPLLAGAWPEDSNGPAEDAVWKVLPQPCGPGGPGGRPGGPGGPGGPALVEDATCPAGEALVWHPGTLGGSGVRFQPDLFKGKCPFGRTSNDEMSAGTSGDTVARVPPRAAAGSHDASAEGSHGESKENANIKGREDDNPPVSKLPGGPTGPTLQTWDEPGFEDLSFWEQIKAVAVAAARDAWR